MARNYPMDFWRGRGRNAFEPTREISQLQRGIDRLFDDFLAPFPSGRFGEGRLGDEVRELTSSWLPSVDVDETEEHYLMTFDLPGVSREDVNIELRDNQLIISGERREDRDEEGKGARKLRERVFGSFMRSFTLPPDADPEKIEASYEDGVLYLAIPRTEIVKPRQISIGEKRSGVFSRLLSKAAGKRSEIREGKQKKGEEAA